MRSLCGILVRGGIRGGCRKGWRKLKGKRNVEERRG